MLKPLSAARPLVSCGLLGAALGLGAEAARASMALEEVIVTAQKTEETIQSVPISIQALDAKTLENNSVNNFSDIKALVPSLKFSPYPTAQESLLVTIRGIPPGAIELTQDTPAAVHINGVYIARGNGLNMAVADLERVEVLRGPQGTLYGRNATAGAINLITAKPTDVFSFKQQITVAEYNELLSKTSINVPLTDNLFVRASYLYNTKDGFVDNTAPDGIDFGDKEAQAARFDVRWEPRGDLTIDYGFDWSNQRYYSTPGQCMELGTGLGALMDPAQCSTSFLDKLAFYGHTPKNTTTAQGHTLTVEWDLDALTLRSITGYRQLFDNYYGILFGGGPGITGGSVDFYSADLSLPAQSNHTKQHQFSEELQLQGDIGDTASFSTGLYYFEEHGAETKGYGAALILNTAPGVTSLSMNGPRDLSVTNKSAAIFGQLKWTPDFADGKLDIVPGIRYTRDKREASMFERRGTTLTQIPGMVITTNTGSSTPVYTGYPDPGVYPLTGTPARFSKDFSKTTPSITLQYHINADVMTYAKYVEGYKSGGTAVRASNTAAFEQGFNPETLQSYEVGVKSSWLDERLRVNADVFQSKFKDQQVTVRNLAVASTATTNVPFDIINAGRSTYNGVELEIQAALSETVRLSANYAYLDFKYDKVEDPATGIDVSRFYHNLVPTNAYSVNADWTPGDIGYGSLSFNLSYSYTDAQSGPYQDAYTITGNVVTPGAKTDPHGYVTPAYGIWNARAALSDIPVGPGEHGGLTLALWAKNLANKHYINYAFLTVQSAANYQGFWGEPRTVGVDLVYRYE